MSDAPPPRGPRQPKWSFSVVHQLPDQRFEVDFEALIGELMDD